MYLHNGGVPHAKVRRPGFHHRHQARVVCHGEFYANMEPEPNTNRNSATSSQKTNQKIPMKSQSSKISTKNLDVKSNSTIRSRPTLCG
jgi:hypothetical protein